MLFNSYLFLFVFLPIVLVVYFLARRMFGYLAAVVALCLSSYIFYLAGERVYPWLIAVSIAVNFSFGLAIRAQAGARRTALTAAAVVLNLACLFVFKYLNFAVTQIDAAFGADLRIRTIVLPVGISFFTFTQLAYLIDVYKGKVSESRVSSYVLFVTFFPHLIAGPILHHQEMMPQFGAPQRRVLAPLYSGLALLAIGLAKKVLVADSAAKVATELFTSAQHSSLGLFTAWLAALAYTVQIYFDFSGYSDMAIGVSQMLGIRLPLNFNSPYKAVSITDFWRRWHITLSRFLRDYLYIPLGGNRRGEGRQYVNILTTMLLGGIWHGAGWTFVVWGALHGTAQMICHGWRHLVKTRRLPRLHPLAGRLLTGVFVVLAWVPFRAANMTVAARIWHGMLGLDGFALPAIGPLRRLGDRLGVGTETVSFHAASLVLIALALLVAVLAPNSQQLLREFDVGLDSPNYNATGAASRLKLDARWPTWLFLAALLGLSLRFVGSYSEFIYFQF